MATRGRKPLPDAVKSRRGNPGRRAASDGVKVEAKAPPCPSHLDKEAKKEWRRVCKKLVELKIVTELDRAVLTGYCEAWSLYVQASRDVQEHGTVAISEKGAVYQSPYVNLMATAMKQMQAFAAELGMTPSARSRVKPTGETGKSNSLLDFLGIGSTN